MSSSIFDEKDYKKFLVRLIASMPNGGRGVRGELAAAIGCQVAYVSHVLAGEKHFSLEQIEAAARFFHLRSDETEMLILMVEFARAGTESLRRYFASHISAKKSDHLEIKNRIQISKGIAEKDQARYYSSWYYQAVHTALTIPKYRSPFKLSKYFEIPIAQINEILLFLLDRGLIEETKGVYKPTQAQIHLPRTSPLISKLHTNWRVRTLSAFDSPSAHSHHYSGVVSLSASDVEKVREILVAALAEAVDVIKPSKEEKLYALSMDYFELGHDDT